tara:strand:+ start:713 stop:1867 length:1155 start_codon:yes stop_codon:yes gene_type:complete
MKTIISLLTLSVSCAVLGQAEAAEYTFDKISVNPYARLVGGISYANNGYEAGESGSRTEVASNQWGTSYVGASMTIELGEKMRGIANLETGFGTLNGETNVEDRLFNRKANVGIQHDDFGQITFGTHLMLGQETISIDPMAFQSMGINTLVNGVNDLFAENSVVYRSPEYSGFQLDLLHKFGGQISDSNRDEGSAVSLSYTHENLSLLALYQETKDEFGRYTGGEFYGLGTQGQWLYAKTSVLGGSYRFDDLKLFAGYQKVEAPDSGYLLSYTFDTDAQMEWVGANYSMSKKLTANVGFYHVSKSYSDKKSNLYTVGINYAFNEHFTFYTTVGYIGNNTINPSLIGDVGANNHALAYWDVACDNTQNCDGTNQVGGYTGVVFRL